jgi:hypothetical protein
MMAAGGERVGGRHGWTVAAGLTGARRACSRHPRDLRPTRADPRPTRDEVKCGIHLASN